MTTENTDNNSDHTRLFETCTAVLQVPEQVQFVASYFNTTTGHATWLLDMYKKRTDEQFHVYSSSIPM